METNDRSEDVKLDRLGQEASEWKPTIDNQKLKWIVLRKKKKWMKEIHQSKEVKFHCFRQENR
jgi:hypothetical protein